MFRLTDLKKQLLTDMEETVEPKKKGRPKKDDGAKTVRVELRLTVEQKELLDLAVSKRKNTNNTEVLIKGLFYYLNNQYWCTPENFQDFRKICNVGS